MKHLKYLFLLLLIGCSSTKVTYDYDNQINFKTYKTFNFFEDVGKGLSALDVKRVTSELAKILEQKEMRFSENPDILINIMVKESKVARRNTIGVGIGGGGNIGIGISGGIPIGSRKINQELVVDFVEREDNQLIWQGIANSEHKESMKPKEKEVYYQNILAKIFKAYPPKKKH
ncbi:MAG: DUF4136 domain-containing protein [Tenacibaculum sp.]